MAINSKVIDRLLTQLNTSGIQQQNFALYQVIKQLIDLAKLLIDLINSTSSSGGGSSTTIILPSIPGMSGNDGDDGMIGPQGLRGIQGPIGSGGAAGPVTIGPMGLNGEDGLQGFPIPGNVGPQGIQGIQGPAGPVTLGPMGLNGEDGDPGYPILINNGNGGGTSSGLESALPASGANGELYLPTNGVYIHRYNGSTWKQWGPIFPLTEPIDGDFTWINQGGASVDTTNGGILLSDVAGASVVNSLRIRKKSAPATPYIVTGIFLVNPLVLPFFNLGLLFRESATGELHTFRIVCGTAGELQIASTKWSSPTTFSAEYVTLRRCLTSNFVFLRIADNGISRICSFSIDGQHWQVFSTIGRTDFLTADEVGFFIDVANTSFGYNTMLLSWKEE